MVMNKYVERTVDGIFSFLSYWPIWLMIIGFGLLLYSAFMSEKRHADVRRHNTEVCYAQGLVVVETDAGYRCADPVALVKVN